MWSFKILERHFLLLDLVLVIGFACTRSAEVSETIQGEITERTSLSNRSSVHEETTIVSLNSVTGSNRKLASSIIVEALPRNSSSVFRPSVHLGEIEKARIRTNPFNNVQHVKFENVEFDRQHDQFQDILSDAYRGVSSILDEATRSSRIKFQDDSVIETPAIRRPFNDPFNVQPTYSSTIQFDEITVKPIGVFGDQTYIQSMERPDTPTIYERPIVDHGSAGVYYDVTGSLVGEYASNNQNAYQPILEETAFETKPDNGVLVLQQQQEATYTRKRKFPYQFYQPSGGYHDVEFIEKPRHSIVAHPQRKKLSSWKRIVQLIGTFLPLGLLLATLTPNVVRIDNTTQPNIVLSKLRVADLPAEHKRSRILDDRSTITCEDRAICELILAGGEPQSNILQNILWNFATRTSDDVARKNGLREVFNAVKEKDCMMITC